MCCNVHIVHFRALHTKIWLFGRGRRARVNSRAISLLAPVALRASRSGELQSVFIYAMMCRYSLRNLRFSLFSGC